MTPREGAIAKRVREWLTYAAEDLSLAERVLAEDMAQLRAVGFHSQQAAEMYLKALLTWRQIEFPKTHDIEDLLELLRRSDGVLVESILDADELTRYAVKTRYPSDTTLPSPEDAVRAVKLARSVRDAVLSILRNIP